MTNGQSLRYEDFSSIRKREDNINMYFRFLHDHLCRI